MLRGLTPTIAVVLLVLSQVLWAIDLTQDIEPRGPLQIRLDYGRATRRNRDNTEKDHEYVFTPHLTFNGPVSVISDGQLVGLAFDAHDEMNANFTAYRP
ncbi:hypothetical protein NLG97_g8944 [Lecanicillium saksenae]|uniref:Uncharacterized protein n=1 Tax=Lecanicillium saksenae TaxID=468837 RepID=A0ACC1QJE7_9HYPO|nr:hypothetical protein NLG97_g8944 [Lecanicillium saksenae]